MFAERGRELFRVVESKTLGIKVHRKTNYFRPTKMNHLTENITFTENILKP